MTLSPIAHRWLVSMLRFAAWGCAQSLIAILVFALLGDRDFTAFVLVIVAGAVSAVLTFGALSAIARRLMWLGFPISGVLVPIVLIPVPNLIECGYPWNCDARLEGSGAGMVASLITVAWMLGAIVIGLFEAAFIDLKETGDQV